MKQALLLQPLGQWQVTCVENFDFRAHAQTLNLRCHFFQHGWGVGHHIVAFTEIHGAAIKRADFRQKCCNMRKALCRARHIGLQRIRRQRRFSRTENKIAADACGQVKHDFHA
ncbi:hypothetical protein D9M70_630330 [compost metagenome]